MKWKNFITTSYRYIFLFLFLGQGWGRIAPDECGRCWETPGGAGQEWAWSLGEAQVSTVFENRVDLDKPADQNPIMMDQY